MTIKPLKDRTIDELVSGGWGCWINIRQTWVDNPDSPYFDIAWIFREAIKKPRQIILQDGTSMFAYYDPDKRRIYTNEMCPREESHHLFDTCWCCGAKG